MTTIEDDAKNYLEWMEIHNYAARTRSSAGGGTSGTSLPSPAAAEVDRGEGGDAWNSSSPISTPCSPTASVTASRCRFGTQAQRLVPVTQFFSWLRREHRIDANPAADLLMPRPDRRLPEAHA